MTEKQVFQILLKEESNAKTFHYPKLQKEAVVIISKNLSNIIYESLKQKSSASNIKRRNILKFVNTICEVKEHHSFGNDWIDQYLLVIRKSFENVELCNLLDNCSDELESSISKNFFEKVMKHHEVKNTKRRKNMKYVEFIKEKDQIRMDCKYDIHVVKKFSHYERNENIIRSLITYQPEKTFMKNSFFSQSDYREKQTKLAYALLNMNSIEDDILEGILFRLASYETLESFEQIFLQNLFATGKAGTKVTAFMDRFFFLLERAILEYATNLLTKENELDVCQYFVNLESDDRFLRIREICRKDNTLYLRMKTCIYELYCMSYCNENILKLCELIS